ncbi:hypothetical protein NLG97_g2569 [Lecanicillium saksenae]|uniref:Uncharacterized protein n=1 Tax=Lecanicillium saksenae TaxID=468837 RepID=A0ACC1R0L3_9HYPO|nr:hypothetical protein NLG97_g2569 [Lecanicillium saksenae]
MEYNRSLSPASTPTVYSSDVENDLDSSSDDRKRAATSVASSRTSESPAPERPPCKHLHDTTVHIDGQAAMVNEYEEYINSTSEKILDILAGNESVKMTLPAFPFKSSNPNKVTGLLPDCGEYLGLQRLNQMCLDIRKVYGHGARVIIATDGAAFNDLLLISDETVWKYGQAVKAMVKSNGFGDNIEVMHAAEILGLVEDGLLSEELFYTTTEPARQMIKDEFCASEEQIRQLVETDPDSRLTFTGFKAFCKLDMENTDMKKHSLSNKAYMKAISSLCIQMMGRSEGFGKLIRAKMPHHIRLSIHPSSGAVKLSVCLVPQPSGSISRSPWMSTIAVSKNGVRYTVHVKDVRDTHELILKDGLPWFYKERTVPLSTGIVRRNAYFEKLWQQYNYELQQKPRSEIDVTVLTDSGKILLRAACWHSTPASLLRHLGQYLPDDALAARVDGEIRDLNHPLERDCSVAYIYFDSSEGRDVFWRSCCHILGGAFEREYSSLVANCENTETGFFCETPVPKSGSINESSSTVLEGRVLQTIGAKGAFDRLEVTKADLQEMFSYNKYKMRFINTLRDTDMVTVYRCGSFIDISAGPHIQNSSKIKAFRILQNSASYWLGDVNKDSLNRTAAIAFPNKKLMNEHLEQLTENEKRSHLYIGKRQELFFFDAMSPGSVFLLPNGTRIFNALQQLLREEYCTQGYQEVQTPNIYNTAIWKTSGHWQHYKENMFRLDVDGSEWALKPMNCPGHFILFGHKTWSYRDLPLRIADFGVLHRNEASGALRGLTRVRKFQQDDSHIFCAEDQIGSEIENIFRFLEKIYGIFGFTFKLKMSTRPDKYLGDLATWDYAEAQLRNALTKCYSDDWVENPGDGAFYGPKIDITIEDAFKREFQCATIQLDYQAPVNFDLKYTGKKGSCRPVVIHRAIIGSFERFLAILTEHFGGNWPFWISPRQILVIPVAPGLDDYAQQVHALLRADGFNVQVDLSGNTLNKKIRSGELAQYNFIFVVGAREEESNSVSVRYHDSGILQQHATVPLSEVRGRLRWLKDTRDRYNRI